MKNLLSLHMLPVAVLSVASLGESGKAERESCLRNYKNASAFFFCYGRTLHMLSLRFLALFPLNFALFLGSLLASL